MKNLVIVESPSKAKTIQKYLGNDFKVMASSGHICDLPEKSLGIDVEHNFEPVYEIPKEKKNIIKQLKDAVKESDDVYLAADPDREGEAISWHLSKVLELGDNTKRIVFNEISPKAIRSALETPRAINHLLVDAQQARRVIDRLVGYKISPILNKKIKQGLSGGRVQSAALKMIVDREREIRAFKPEEYWLIYAGLAAGHAAVKALLNDHNGKKIKVDNGEKAETIEQKLRAAKSWFVDSVVKGKSKSHPSPPFTTSTLQQDGSTRLQMTAPEVMKIAQQLYEGIELPGEGHTALVTYIRTDSVRVSPEAQREALNYIERSFGKEYTPDKPNFYASKGANVQDAHEAIRPISLERTPESIKDKVNRNQYRLYKLIYERFLASQMREAEYATLKVHITADSGDEKFGFKVSGKTVIFKGYTAVYDNQKEDEEGEENAKLPNFNEGDALRLSEIKKEQKFTKPPARFTDATLVKAMEESGVGRPSTYATVISTLEKREYTEKSGKNIVPTSLGETVTEFMENNFSDIVDINFTADMEAKLDEVENGTDWHKVLQDFYPEFLVNIKKAMAGSKKLLNEEVTDVICEKCGANMVIRTGRFGKFLACPNFPECKNIKNIVESVGTCPRCGGEIVRKKTKGGKTFFGCANYPECDFMSWELPAPHFCPKCRAMMRIVEKDGKKKYVCVNRKCNYTEIVRTEETVNE
ncbi:MAG TPA: type I DNA topoisomerase [Clostridia bacterium]|nr:type I DNA topoisomerase [Clostridia bacterium]